MKTQHYLLILMLLLGFTACQEQDETVAPQEQSTATETMKERRSSLDLTKVGSVEYTIQDAFLWQTDDKAVRTVQVLSASDYVAVTTQANLCDYYPQEFISEFNNCYDIECKDCMATVVVTTTGVGAPWE